MTTAIALTTKTTPKTREEWMMEIARALEPRFIAAGYKEIPVYRITLSLTRKKKAVGLCYAAEASADGTFEILIRLDMADGVEVAAIIAHEMCHAIVGLEHKHGRVFGKAHKAIGLVGKNTQSNPGEEFVAWFREAEATVGAFPHAPLNFDGGSSGPKAQTNRQRKCLCRECGYVCRTTTKWIEDVGAPHCPNHGQMVVEDAEEIPEVPEGDQ